MGVLFIASAEEAAGKTAVCAGLAINFMNNGKKVGYLKLPAPGKGSSDGDIAFMKQILGLADAVKAPDLIKRKDIVLAEGRLGQNAGDAVSRATLEAAREMKAKVIAIEAYSGADSRYLDDYQGYGDKLLGVVINKVPESQLKRVREVVGVQFEAAGIKLLGVIPENRVLLAITVGELAESLQGKILNNAEKSDELIENYMLGAMVVDSGLDYFGRRSRKAVIIRQDRPDMQLAALETSTVCLVLSGNHQPPLYNVLYKAESRGIPIIATGAAVNDIVTIMESALLKTGLRQSKKMAKLAEMVKQSLDMKALN